MRVPRRLLLGAALAAPFLRPAAAQAARRVRIIHVNDFHSRHEPVVRATGAACRANESCLGGSARLAGGVAAARAEAAAAGRAVIAVDAGDQFMGSLFYTEYRGAAELAVMKAWGCEAMTLGNHEFDNGAENLARFVAGTDFPILAANIDTRAEPALDGRFRPWWQTTRDGARIAFVGVTTPETPQLSSPGRNLRFTDPAEAAARAIAEIRANGPATVVLLSHLGIGADRRMAEQVAGIDVIIGGHSHTLLAAEPDADGPSPMLVDGRDRTVRILQTGAYGRFLGRLDLDLAMDGRIAAQGGSTAPMGAEIAEDARVAAMVAEFARPLEATRRRPVGTLPAELSNAGCRRGECALGNLVAEAMLARIPGAEIAITNGGGLRAGLPGGQVTIGDVLTVLPFGNTVAVMGLRGADVAAALEHGLSQGAGTAGRFPQVAGLRFAWDPAAPPGSRLRQVEVAQGASFAALDPGRVYRVVTNDFMRKGGDGYVMFRDRALDPYDTGPVLDEVVAEAIAAGRLAGVPEDGRIRVR
ncbi:bifunctional metallophosphatase/5'-nucleotidase [Roseomonas eburnea]|uniref:Bifunctional metallophosphatase/5'-nucleotidase n=1 Tax=Neoroseomonas eburnea TaxID=1346889 RepID=A0A9X9XJA6_9PROT|nr:5'-nucleotidase C-terminal domain-containing protein [Neoroseomonas eburnea]MBR0683792.1 bifunctional metallophosphatase/5'-nucleotidase [Neoroseomonas eburnea]